MENAKILIYDGSFNGFLTAVFVAFEKKTKVADIQKNTGSQNRLFSDTETVFTQMEKAKRVWNTIQGKNHLAIKNIYFSFLSESKGIELLLYRYIRSLFRTEEEHFGPKGFGEAFLKIEQLSKSVAREKNRTEAFVRFQSTRDNVQFAFIAPDFDILPLVSRYFRFRYSQREWIVYDLKRKYGLYYDLSSVELISLNAHEVRKSGLFEDEQSDGAEFSSIELWNDYFNKSYIKTHIISKLRTAKIPIRNKSLEGERQVV